VRRHFFSIRWSNHEDDDQHATPLPDEVAALDYANRIIRELKEGGGCNDPPIDDGREKRDAQNGAVIAIPRRLRLRPD